MEEVSQDSPLPGAREASHAWTWTYSQRLASAVLLGVMVCLLGYRVWVWKKFVADPLPAEGQRAGEMVKRIDPNIASVGELSILPNVGLKKAQAIVEFREGFVKEHPGEAAFPEPEALTQVKGIGDTTVENLREYLVFPESAVGCLGGRMGLQIGVRIFRSCNDMDLTPKQVVEELDKYIIGQGDAKRAVAIALRNRWRRQQLPEGLKNDVYPKNIIMVGPTGVGKTEIARRLAGLTGAPFIKVEATKYTEVGYQGRDVESMIRDLLDYAINMVRDEMTDSVKESAKDQVEDRLLDLLLPANPYNADDEARERYSRNREKLREQLRAGQLEDRLIEIHTEEKPNMSSLLGQAGLDVEMQGVFEKMMPMQRDTKRMTVNSARQFLFRGEADKLLDKQKVIAEAVVRTENSGIVFIDEIDKIAGSDPKSGPDVSRQGVQRDLLPIVEGSAVSTKHGPVRTDHVLFIAAGAFHDSKPSDLMPELQGRFPLRVELQDLTKFDFIRILKEPQNSLVKQQVALLGTEGIEIVFTDDAIDAMAQTAWDVNKRTQNLGARRLYTVMEKVFEDLNFEAPDLAERKLTIDAKYVRQRLEELASEGKRKFIF